VQIEGDIVILAAEPQHRREPRKAAFLTEITLSTLSNRQAAVRANLQAKMSICLPGEIAAGQ
jgi:hypothetical protein